MLQRIESVGPNSAATGPTGPIRSVVRRVAPIRRMAVGAADDPLEHEADAAAERVIAAVRTPSMDSGEQNLRIRRREFTVATSNPAIRRTLAKVADTADMDAVKLHVAALQDTGRTFRDEMALLRAISKLKMAPEFGLDAKFAAVASAGRGSDAVAIRTAINELADAVNPITAELMSCLGEVRDRYSDINDALRAKDSGGMLQFGDDVKMMQSATSKIRQAVFKEDPLEFAKEIGTFEAWIEKEPYRYVYDEYIEEVATAAAVPDTVDAVVTPVPNVVTLAQLRTVAPCGLTAGQRYTPDKSFGKYRFHVSISFKINEDKANLKLPPTKKKAEVEKFHVSFEPNAGGDKTYYWWKKGTKKGTYVYDTVAGVGGTTAMKDKAVEMVKAVAPLVNCTA